MIARALWYALLAAIGLVTVWLQLDREAEASPQLASLVPEPLRAYAQARIVDDALVEDRAGDTVAQAERLVAQRPVPAEHLIMLAVAQSRAGEDAASVRSIELAGLRGWRDPLAQEGMVRFALEAGVLDEAARRYTALMLQEQTPKAVLEELGPSVFTTEGSEGRAAMAQVVAGSNRWGRVFLRRGALVMPPDAFREVTQRSIAAGARFDCKAFGRAVAALARRDKPAAQALAQTPPADCPIDR